MSMSMSMERGLKRGSQRQRARNTKKDQRELKDRDSTRDIELKKKKIQKGLHRKTVKQRKTDILRGARKERWTQAHLRVFTEKKKKTKRDTC